MSRQSVEGLVYENDHASSPSCSNPKREVGGGGGGGEGEGARVCD